MFHDVKNHAGLFSFRNRLAHSEPRCSVNLRPFRAFPAADQISNSAPRNQQSPTQSMKTRTLSFLISAGCALALLAGCAFNLSTVKQQPVAFTAQAEAAPGFVLTQDVKVKLGTGFPTFLKHDTRWRAVGTTEYGTVFATKDQIVTVEESHIHEAQLVVANQCITGFYFPVENKFAPVSRPIPIETRPLNQN